MDPDAHQPRKDELNEGVSIDATPVALSWTIIRDGSERRKVEKRHGQCRFPQGTKAESTMLRSTGPQCPDLLLMEEICDGKARDLESSIG